MVAFQDLIVPLFPFIFVIVFLYGWRRPVAASNARKRLPPSPRRLPIIGNLHQLGTCPHRSLHSLSKRHGPVMLLHFGHVPVLVASSAEAAREIMKNQDLIFSNRPKLSIPDRLIYGSRDIAFSPYGDYWRQVRSICVLHLLSNKRVQSFRRVREEETSLMVDKIRESGSSVVDLSDVLTSLTNDVISRVALGKKYGEYDEAKELKKFMADFQVLLGSSPVGDYIPWLAWINRVNGLDRKVERIAKLYNEFLVKVLQEHKDDHEKKHGKKIGDIKDDDSVLDLVDILLEFQRESGNTVPLEDETIKAIIVDMFGAGTDTTAAVLEWTMAELIRNPRSMKILQNEVREVGRNKREIEEEDLEKMPYLKAVIKEGLRLHSPVPLLVPRESTQDTKVLGYDIASNTQVMINVWAIGRDPSLWENPEEFRPERFLDTSVDFKGLHFEFIPFGAGRRGCPGVVFAIAVDELVLAKLVHNFNFALPNAERQENLDMTEAYGITVHKKFPLLVVATPRT